MAQKRILKRDASTGRVSEGASGDTYFSDDPSVSSDLTTKNYSDGHLGGGDLDVTNIGVAGKIPIAQGDGSVSFQDPYVQGVFDPGTDCATANGTSPPAPLKPVLIGGEGDDGALHDIATDDSGQLKIVSPDAEGTAVSTPINPFYVGGQSTDGKLYGFLTDDNKYLYTNVTNTVTVAISGTPAVTVTGTVTANIGTTGGLALDATLTGGTQQTKLVDAGGSNLASVSSGGALKVDGSAVTQPVSGTVTADAGSGTFSVATEVQIDYNTGAGTQNLSMIGLALPSSSGTVAGGTASNPIQVSIANTGANGTAIKVDGSAVTQPVSGTITANAGTGTFITTGDKTHNNAAPDATNVAVLPALCNTSDPTFTDGKMTTLSVDTSGKLRVAGSFTGSSASVGATGAAVPADADFIGAQDGSGNLQGLVCDDSNFLKVSIADSLITDPAEGTPGSAIPAKALMVGGSDGTDLRSLLTSATGQLHVIADSGSTTAATIADGADVTLGAKADAKSTATDTTAVTLMQVAKEISYMEQNPASRAVTNSGTFATQSVCTNGGTFAVQATLSANATLPYSASVNATKAQVKGTAGTVFGWSILNTTAAIAYMQVWDLASASVTVGTTAATYIIPIPANSTTGAGSNLFSEKGWTHGTGITVACTTTRTGSSNAACDVLMFYS